MSIRTPPLIISLGGSIIVPDAINASFLREFRSLILAEIAKGRRFVIICGGGSVSRKYIAASREIVPELDDDSLDLIGISGTAINAFLVKTVFGDKVYEKVMTNPTARIKTGKPVIVGCGWKPGCSSDYAAVLAAQAFGAGTVINLTSIDYIYDKDPAKNPDAQRLESITWSRLRTLMGDAWTPKMDFPFDPSAAKLSQKLGLKVIVAKGTDLGNLKNILEGRRFRGTTISG